MTKRTEYAIGILFNNGKIKFVTRLGEHHVAYLEDGKQALYFSKECALDICYGFAWNGISAVPIMKQDYMILINLGESEK